MFPSHSLCHYSFFFFRVCSSGRFRLFIATQRVHIFSFLPLAPPTPMLNSLRWDLFAAAAAAVAATAEEEEVAAEEEEEEAAAVVAMVRRLLLLEQQWLL